MVGISWKQNNFVDLSIITSCFFNVLYLTCSLSYFGMPVETVLGHLNLISGACIFIKSTIALENLFFLLLLVESFLQSNHQDVIFKLPHSGDLRNSISWCIHVLLSLIFFPSRPCSLNLFSKSRSTSHSCRTEIVIFIFLRHLIYTKAFIFSPFTHIVLLLGLGPGVLVYASVNWGLRQTEDFTTIGFF